MKKTVCVDLDGVLAQYDGWKGDNHIGDPIDGALDFMKELSESFDVVVYTARNHLEPVFRWLRYHRFPYDALERKRVAVAYIDDRGVSCLPQEDPDAFKESLRRCRELAS